MLSKSTLLHLRIPFSFFLLPVFLFAVSQSPTLTFLDGLLIFIILHLFLYPASNAYNSYFDKDEESIGGLEKPPPVSQQLYYTALVFDFLALILSFFFNWIFVLMVLIYGLISKAYSNPRIRLKKYPYLSWLIIGVFQGYFTFMMVAIGLSGAEVLYDLQLNLAGLLSTALLLGSYPMTQVYQHKEDAKRGDITLSLKLGVKGTFIFTAIVFMIATGLYCLYFKYYYSWFISIAFLSLLFPVLIYFLLWFAKVLQNEKAADFKSTMRLNLISAICMNVFFAYLIIAFRTLPTL